MELFVIFPLYGHILFHPFSRLEIILVQVILCGSQELLVRPMDNRELIPPNRFPP